jgi:hypothetical protein
MAESVPWIASVYPNNWSGLIDAQITQLEEEIESQNAPLEEAVCLLAEIPGFDRTTAWSVIAEIGIM